MSGTLSGQLIELGKYGDAVRLENELSEAIKEFENPTNVFCVYKSIPEHLEDRFFEYHDLLIKRSFKSKY
jgi:hypothetical protein